MSEGTAEMITLDAYDRKILALLQTDCSLSVMAVSEAVGLSQTPCWKRIKRMEEEGLIRRRVALVDRKMLGYNVLAIVVVKTNHHEEQWLRRFVKNVNEIPEVLEFYRTAGNVDYFLKIVMRNIEEYDGIYKKLIKIEGVYDISAYFSMEELKAETKVPVTSPMLGNCA
ncbi:Lrp/AsnC family transcriptional regulator [Hyphococcus lacteus]|uniref:Lrp/AsnC family transcriptional regulator n=1 Tax=Hyphococcus lacteus TaxID=3143536 RepID=A0ABV3Z6R2_9PROT